MAYPGLDLAGEGLALLHRSPTRQALVRGEASGEAWAASLRCRSLAAILRCLHSRRARSSQAGFQLDRGCWGCAAARWRLPEFWS